MKKAAKLLSVVALGLVSLTSCAGQTGESAVDSSVTSSVTSSVAPTPESISEAIFGTLEGLYSWKTPSDSLLIGKSYSLTASLADFSDYTVTYSVDSTKTEYKSSIISYTLGAQKLLSVKGTSLTLAYDEFDSANPYAAFTGTVTIDGEEYSHDFLICVSEPEAVSIKDITKQSNGDIIKFTGYWQGTNGVLNADFNDYNACFVGDGTSSIMLYQVKANLLDLENYKLNETVLEVVGTYSPYNGLPEVKVSSIKTLTAEEAAEYNLTVPTVPVINAENPDYTFAESDINRFFEIENAVVTDVESDSYKNLSISFTVGEGTVSYFMYLDSRYYDSKTFDAASLKTGDKFSAGTWLSYNSSKTPAYRFNYLSSFSIEK